MWTFVLQSIAITVFDHIFLTKKMDCSFSRIRRMKVPDIGRNSKNETCFGKEKKCEPSVRERSSFRMLKQKSLEERNSIIYFLGEPRIFGSSRLILVHLREPEITRKKKYLKTIVMEREIWNIECSWSVTWVLHFPQRK